jgi:hypothetical protein
MIAEADAAEIDGGSPRQFAGGWSRGGTKRLAPRDYSPQVVSALSGQPSVASRKRARRVRRQLFGNRLVRRALG